MRKDEIVPAIRKVEESVGFTEFFTGFRFLSIAPPISVMEHIQAIEKYLGIEVVREPSQIVAKPTPDDRKCEDHRAGKP